MAELTVAEREERRNGLGGSDIGPVFGMGYGTPFSVWANKLWAYDVEVTPIMQRGHDLEPIVAAKFTERTGSAVLPGGRHDHPDHPWLYATLDYREEVTAEPVECKVVGRYTAPEWGPSCEPDGIPGHYELQLREQMEVVGAEFGTVAALFVDEWELRYYTIEADPVITGLLVEGASAFWHDHVLARVPPPITDPAKDWDALKTIPLNTERSTDLPPEAGELIHTWRSARADKKAAVAVEAECKAELGRLLDGAGTGLVDGEVAVTASEHYRGDTLVRKLTDRKQWRNENG